MLRIDIHNDSGQTVFTVEGKLRAPWVSELERCWQDAISRDPSTPILVNLNGATCLDEAAKQLLARMYDRGARLSGSGLMTGFIIREIESARGR